MPPWATSHCISTHHSRLNFHLDNGRRKDFSRGVNGEFFQEEGNKIFSGGANHCEISFNQFKTDRKSFFYKNIKFQNQDPFATPFRSPRGRPNSNILALICRLPGSHEHQLLWGFQCNFLVLWEFKETNPKIALICFEKTFWQKPCWKNIFSMLALL